MHVCVDSTICFQTLWLPVECRHINMDTSYCGRIPPVNTVMVTACMCTGSVRSYLLLGTRWLATSGGMCSSVTVSSDSLSGYGRSHCIGQLGPYHVTSCFTNHENEGY